MLDSGVYSPSQTLQFVLPIGGRPLLELAALGNRSSLRLAFQLEQL